MKIWIENPFDNLPSEGYRPQRYYLMAEAFVAAGHQVVYWTADFSHSRKKYREIQGELFSNNIEIKLIPTRQYKKNVSIERVLSHREYARKWEKMALEYASENSSPDIIIASMPTLSASCAALRLKKELNAFFVADIMDAWPATFRRLLPNGCKWLYKVLFAPLRKEFCEICKGADFVTGVSSQYEPEVMRAGAKSFLKTYHAIRLSLDSHLKLPDETIRLVYAGGVGRTYDLETIVMALPKLPRCTFTIAGSGPEIKRLRSLSEKINVSDRFFTPGYLRQRELEELLISSHIGVLPMEKDSFVGMPYKLADYVSAAMPVVSSLEGESLDLINKYSAGLQYAAKDTLSFVGAVNAISEDIISYSAAAKRMAEAEFDATRLYARYVNSVISAKMRS
ncbi:MAG: glycosyltransferase [Kiritimatiellae bacterium]|nr:glycosyltransferase [Kiritimatiellia bacterium]